MSNRSKREGGGTVEGRRGGGSRFRPSGLGDLVAAANVIPAAATFMAPRIDPIVDGADRSAPGTKAPDRANHLSEL